MAHLDQAGAAGHLGALSAIASQFSTNDKVSKRSKISHEQVAVLTKFFEVQPLPDYEERLALAQQLDMTPRSVQVWFQNRRQRTKPGYAPAAQSKAARALVALEKPQSAPLSPDDSYSESAAPLRTASTSSTVALALAPGTQRVTARPVLPPAARPSIKPVMAVRQGLEWKAPRVLGTHSMEHPLDRPPIGDTLGRGSPYASMYSAAYPAAASLPAVPLTPSTSSPTPFADAPVDTSVLPPPVHAPPPVAPPPAASEALASPGATNEGVNALLMLCGTAV